MPDSDEGDGEPGSEEQAEHQSESEPVLDLKRHVVANGRDPVESAPSER